jgi:hypothetical protein
MARMGDLRKLGRIAEKDDGPRSGRCCNRPRECELTSLIDQEEVNGLSH